MTDTNRMKIKLDTSSGIRKIFPFNFMSIKHASFKQSLAFFLLLGNWSTKELTYTTFLTQCRHSSFSRLLGSQFSNSIYMK